MKLRTSGSLASGIHGVPSGYFCQECARLKAWPISWQAVQKRIRCTQAAGAGSPAGGVRDEGVIEDRRALAVVRADVVEHDAAEAGALLVQRRRRSTHSAHCGTSAKRDQ